MRFGQMLAAPSGGGDNAFDSMLALARASEAAGLDSVWVTDHFMFRNTDAPDEEIPLLECFVTLGALAAATRGIRLGSFVAGAPYRNPALLAKMVATLDVISHGRSIVGLGAGWHEEEFRAYGWPFPPVQERLARLAEAVQVVKALLTERPASFAGEYYTIAAALNDPRPVQRPRPPILIGGGGERVTLRLVAQHADLCNVFGDPATVARKFAVLRAHCADVGRPYEAITRTNHVTILLARDEAELARKRARYTWFPAHPVVGTPDAVIVALREFAAAGSQYVIFNLADAYELESTRLFGETVLPALAGV
jgi:F420-dependent oxidoreductase-like protein